MLSLPVRQQAGQAAVPKNKSQVLKMGKVFTGCPASGPGWGLGGRSGVPSPSISMEASGSWCRFLMAPNHFFQAGEFPHIELSPHISSRLSMRLEGSTLRMLRSCFRLSSKTRRLLVGSSFRQGLAFAGGVSVSRAATQPSTLAGCLRVAGGQAPPRTPWSLGYPTAWLTDASTECAFAACSAP